MAFLRQIGLPKSRCGQPIDAARVLFPPVFHQSLGSFFFRPLRQRLTFLQQVHPRHREAAGCLHARNVRHNDLPHAGHLGEKCRKVHPLRLGALHRSPRAVEPQNLRRPFKGTEHESDSPIFEQMCRGFIPAPGQVEIRHARGRKHAKRIKTLGRQIHVPLWRERCRGHEEQGLRQNKCLNLFCDLRIRCRHRNLPLQKNAGACRRRV